MKKIYQHPETIVIKISAVSLLIVSGEGLEGLTSGGNSPGGKSADSRGYDFDEEDEYE